MIIFLWVASVLASPSFIDRPAPPEKVDGECSKSYPISRGQLLSDKLVSSSVHASCSAVAVPLSDYADLLSTEKWSEAIEQQCKIEMSQLNHDLDWYKARLEQETKEKPFIERPGTQRWLGRIETIAIVGIVSVGLASAYSYGAGVAK